MQVYADVFIAHTARVLLCYVASLSSLSAVLAPGRLFVPQISCTGGQPLKLCTFLPVHTGETSFPLPIFMTEDRATSEIYVLPFLAVTSLNYDH